MTDEWNGTERRKNNDVQFAVIHEQLKNIMEMQRNTAIDTSEIKGIVTKLALHEQRLSVCEAYDSTHNEMANEHVSTLSNHEIRITNCEASIKDLLARFWGIITIGITAVIAFISKRLLE